MMISILRKDEACEKMEHDHDSGCFLKKVDHRSPL